MYFDLAFSSIRIKAIVSSSFWILFLGFGSTTSPSFLVFWCRIVLPNYRVGTFCGLDGVDLLLRWGDMVPCGGFTREILSRSTDRSSLSSFSSTILGVIPPYKTYSDCLELLWVPSRPIGVPALELFVLELLRAEGRETYEASILVMGFGFRCYPVMLVVDKRVFYLPWRRKLAAKLICSVS